MEDDLCIFNFIVNLHKPLKRSEKGIKNIYTFIDRFPLWTRLYVEYCSEFRCTPFYNGRYSTKAHFLKCLGRLPFIHILWMQYLNSGSINSRKMQYLLYVKCIEHLLIPLPKKRQNNGKSTPNRKSFLHVLANIRFIHNSDYHV